ncbi:helix-turn-helix transcriptional regulator [Streptomyces sp. NPDC048182]|uniref:helix-turn-helix transcriptional regulator n=1 Tax=Streptomyces sp. NPDC048182 TaxID=3365507 RepID=UPI003722C8B3
MEHLVQHAVTTIHERYGEALSLDDLARTAMVSKYHFLRQFTRVTGVTPGRFLNAVRLQEAKRLLRTTPLTVADIAVRVGYSSAGSFTRRFTEAVALSPTGYRALSRTPRTPRTAVPAPAGGAARPARCGAVGGVLHPGDGAGPPVCVGAFAGPLVQGAPVCLADAGRSGRFHLPRVPEGTWYLHALAHPAVRARGRDTATLLATAGPLEVRGGAAHRVDLTLCAPDWTRPPVLSALAGPGPHPLAA